MQQIPKQSNNIHVFDPNHYLMYMDYDKLEIDKQTQLNYDKNKKPESQIQQQSLTDQQKLYDIQKIIRSRLQYHTSLKWIVSDEMEQIKHQKLQSQQSTSSMPLLSINFKSPLQLYEENKQKQDYVISFDEFYELNQVLFDKPLRKFGHPRTIAIAEDIFVFGGSLGSILLFRKVESKYQTQLVLGQNDNGYVSALDISEANMLVAAGFETGTIGIINIAKGQYIKTCKEIHPRCRVLLIKFLFYDVKKFSVISSDDQGCTRITHFENGFFGYDYLIQLGLQKQVYPFTCISVLSQNLQDIYCQENNGLCEYKLVALGQLQLIYIVKIYNDIDAQIEIIHSVENIDKNPLYCSVSWGQGILPAPSIANQDLWKKPKLQLLIALNNHLHVLVQNKQEFSHSNDTFCTLQPLLFNPNDPIQQINYLGESIIGVYTQDKSFYLINTQNLDLFINAKTINNVEHLHYKDKWKGRALTNIYHVKASHSYSSIDLSRTSVGQSRSNLDEDSQSQITTRTESELDFSDKVFPIECSYAVALNNHKSYILCDRVLVCIQLNDWQQAVDNLIDGSNWSGAMYLIKSVKNGSLKYAPTKSLEQMAKIIEKTTQITSVYLQKVVIPQMRNHLDKFKSMQQKSFEDEQTTTAHSESLVIIQSMMSLMIDFLLCIKGEILFDQVFQILKLFVKGDIYILASELRNYIKNNRLKNVIFTGTALTDLVIFYHERNDSTVIQQLISSIDLNRSDVEPLMQLCFQHQLIKPLTYICTNLSDKDFIAPLMKLWGIFTQSQANQQYEQTLYSGLNILTYLDNILEQYQSNNIQNCDVMKSHDFLRPLARWLFEEQTIMNLFMVDLSGTMEVLFRFFQAPLNLILKTIKIKNIQSNTLEYWEGVLERCMNDLKKNGEQPLAKLQQAQRASITNKHQPHWLVLIEQVSAVYDALFYINAQRKGQGYKLIHRLLKQPEALDFIPLSRLLLPHLHDNQEISDDSLKFCVFYSHNQHLIQLIDEIDTNNLDELIELAQLAQLNYLQIRFTELSNMLIKTLDLKIHIYKKYQSIKMDEHLEVFNWVHNIISQGIQNIKDLKDRIRSFEIQDKKEFKDNQHQEIQDQKESKEKDLSHQIQNIKDIKDRVLHYLNVFVQINPSRTRQLIQAFFQDSDIAIVSKLKDSPHLQLEYLEHILKLEKDVEVDEQLITQKIQLLCRLHPEKVLDFLQHNTYSLDDAIEVCFKYGAIKGLSYLYERQGASIKAVQVLISAIKPQIDDIPTIINSMNELIQLCIRLSRFDDADEVWVTFVDALLDIKFNTKVGKEDQKKFDEQLARVFLIWSQSGSGKFLEQITVKYTHLRAEYLRDTFLGMYKNQMFLENVFQSSKDIFQNRIVQDSFRIEAAIRKGSIIWGFCYECNKQISKSNQNLQSVIQFFCGHTYHMQCIESEQMNKTNTHSGFYYKCPECSKDIKKLYLDIFKSAKSKKKELRQNQPFIEKEVSYFSLAKKYLKDQLDQEVSQKKNWMAEKISQQQFEASNPLETKKDNKQGQSRLQKFDQNRFQSGVVQQDFILKLRL